MIALSPTALMSPTTAPSKMTALLMMRHCRPTIAPRSSSRIDVASADRLSIVAHSQGCLVGLEFASRYPARLRSLSLVASGLATPVNDALLDAARNDPEAAIGMMTGWGFGHAGHHHLGPIPGNSMVDGAQSVLRRNTPDALAADLDACNRYGNGKRAAESIRCPVQVIVAGSDRMAPRRATDELIAHLPDPDVATIEGCGHIVPQEAPDRCRELLRNFIFRHNPPV